MARWLALADNASVSSVMKFDCTQEACADSRYRSYIFFSASARKGLADSAVGFDEDPALQPVNASAAIQDSNRKGVRWIVRMTPIIAKVRIPRGFPGIPTQLVLDALDVHGRQRRLCGMYVAHQRRQHVGQNIPDAFGEDETHLAPHLVRQIAQVLFVALGQDHALQSHAAGRHGGHAGKHRRLRFLATKTTPHAPALDQHIVGMHPQRVSHHVLHLRGVLGRAVHMHAAALFGDGIRDLTFQVELLLSAELERARCAVRRLSDRPCCIPPLQAHRRDDVAPGIVRRLGRQHRGQWLDLQEGCGSCGHACMAPTGHCVGGTCTARPAPGASPTAFAPLPTTGTATVPTGQTSVDVSTMVNGDSLVEPNETVIFKVTGSPDGVLLYDAVNKRALDALSYEGSITAAIVTGDMATYPLVEGTVLLAVILQRFRVELLAGERLELAPTVTLRPKGSGLRVRVAARG